MLSVWQFAIARAFSQMLQLSEQRLLNRKEFECQQVLEKAVQRYEAVETEKTKVMNAK